jgi:predicted transposase YdaD
MTWAEKFEARAIEKGQQEGLQKGRQKGMQEILLDLLRARFRSLPPDIARRVEAITSPRELRRLAKSVLSAGSLEELGLA